MLFDYNYDRWAPIIKNSYVILLVIFECIYVFINPLIDKGFELRSVFDFRRGINIKKNIISNLICIVVMWAVYIALCIIICRLTSEDISFTGLSTFLFLATSIYMLNSGMTVKTRYKVVLIILFASAPIIAFLGVIYTNNTLNYYDHSVEIFTNRFMGSITAIYVVAFIITLIMFIHYWKREDVR